MLLPLLQLHGSRNQEETRMSRSRPYLAILVYKPKKCTSSVWRNCGSFHRSDHKHQVRFKAIWSLILTWGILGSAVCPEHYSPFLTNVSTAWVFLLLWDILMRCIDWLGRWWDSSWWTSARLRSVRMPCSCEEGHNLDFKWQAGQHYKSLNVCGLQAQVASLTDRSATISLSSAVERTLHAIIRSVHIYARICSPAC